MKINRLITFLPFVLSVFAVQACTSALPPTDIEPGGSIALSKVSGGDLADPNGKGWRDIASYRVELEMAPPVHPSVELRYDEDAPTTPIVFQVAADETDLFIRMKWQDSSENIANTFEKFSDGAAVQFALSGGIYTSYMMGLPDEPVNIWYWKAGEDEAQNLLAGGFGSTHHSDEQNVVAESRYLDADAGTWSVVFSRPLESGGELDADLSGEQPIFVTFAIWQGDAKQRDGSKSITVDWIEITQSAP